MKHTLFLSLLMIFAVTGCATHEHGPDADHSHEAAHDGHGEQHGDTHEDMHASAHAGSNSNAATSLHDIWVAISVAGQDLSLPENTSAPQLEIFVADKRIVGFDGCNNFQGNIMNVSDSSLEFGPLMSTRKYCQNMPVSDTFNQKLALVKSYKREGLVLSLFDAEGNTLMKLKKVD